MTAAAPTTTEPPAASSPPRRTRAWALAGFAVGVLCALGIILRLQMLRDRAPIEGQYAVNVHYGPWHIASRGDLFSVRGDLPVVSNYTSGLNYGAVDFTTTYLHGAALSLARIGDPLAIGWAYFALPWQGLVLVPLVFLALYTRFCRLRAVAVRPAAVVAIYAFAAYGHYAMVNWGISGGTLVPYGWVLFLIAYLAIFMRQADYRWRLRWTILFIFVAILVQPTYHTASLALIVGIVYVAAAMFVITRRTMIGPNTVVMVITLSVAFLIFHAVTFFGDYTRLFRRFLSDIFRSQENQTFAYFYRLDQATFALQLVNYAAVAVPTLCLVYQWWRGRRRVSDRLTLYHFVWLTWLVPMGAMFFAWSGTAGLVARVLQFGTLFSVVSAALIFAGGERILRVATAGAIAVATAITLYSVPAADIGTATLLTEDEWSAVAWYQEHVGCDKVILTDFRIGPAFGYEGCFEVIGPTAAVLIRGGRAGLIDDLYYETTAPRIALALDQFATTTGRRADYALVSATMTDARTGIYLPDGHLRPMRPETFAMYGQLPGWEVAYRGGAVLILRRIS
jgi:hypothetical protein